MADEVRETAEQRLKVALDRAVLDFTIDFACMFAAGLSVFITLVNLLICAR